MKINQSSSNMVSRENRQAKQVEQKETVSQSSPNVADRFENLKNETLPPRNNTIGGGHQRKEVPKSKNAQPDGTSTSEAQPETPAWLKGKEHGRGIGWGKDVRPKDTSGTSIGSSNDPGQKGEKVSLDYFDKQKRMKELIVADDNSLKNLDKGDGTKAGESKELGRKNPMEGTNDGVSRGYAKNKSSKQEQASVFGSIPLFNQSGEKPTGSASNPVSYPAIKSGASDPAQKVKISEPQKEKSSTTSGDEAGVSKGIVSSSGKNVYDPKFEIFTLNKIGNTTPAPDSADESHMPKGILAEEKPARKDLATNHDKVAMHDENKRQQEKVYVERQEVFGSMVGRKTNGRSTPAPTDGTTDSKGPRQSTGTGAVDLESKHRKGDPGDGDEA